VPLSERLGLESRRRNLARVLAAQHSQYPREAGALGGAHDGSVSVVGTMLT
jgi:hypothetical protein